ncbi:MAG: HU family DNA-binding protein [Clostridia bacterium]|nr:HU family DNA-binding protein [Clostridia bacterium]
MNKTEFIKAVSDKAGITQKDIAVVYDAILDVATEALKKGEKIQLVGLGTLDVKKVPAKTGINPRTKQAVKIPACNKPVFKFGDAYKARFN